MTWEQWVFEYASLKRKESQDAELITTIMETSSHSIRETLIGLLGLNLVPKTQVEPSDTTPFVPMSFLVGRPEIMKRLLDDLQNEERVEARPDDEFEAFSRDLQARLESGDDFGDMEPVIGPDETTPELRWNTDRMQSLLKSVGVTVVDDSEDQEEPAPSELTSIISEVSKGPVQIPASLPPKGPVVVFDEE